MRIVCETGPSVAVAVWMPINRRATGSIVIEVPSPPPPPPVAFTNSIAHTGHRPGSVDGGVHIIGQMYRSSLSAAKVGVLATS